MKVPSRNDIPFGEENAITRERLARLWAKTDRATRKQVEEFRTDPHACDCIIAHSDGKGYWRSSDIEEIEAYRAEQMAYKDAFEKRIKIIDIALNNLRQQASQAELPF